MIKFIDLFAGIGGFHLAMGKAKCIFASEIDDNAKKTYANNFDIEIDGDITKIDIANIPSHDIICAGFPCSPFSVAGKQQGFTHYSGNLFFNIVEIAKHHKTHVLFLENVKNLKSHNRGNTFTIMLNELDKLNYKVNYKVMNACDYGNIPQNRDRIYIVASKDRSADFHFPEEIKLTNKAIDLIDSCNRKEEKYYQTNQESPSVKKMLSEVKKDGCIYQYRRYYIRKNCTGLCPTLTANMGTGGHNVPLIFDNFGVRKLTPEECLAFMGFPDTFKFGDISTSAKYKQVGNSVVVPVIKRISDNILSTFFGA